MGRCSASYASFVYETSPTIRWLNMEKEEKNCHVLTTALLMRGLWGGGGEETPLIGVYRSLNRWCTQAAGTKVVT